MRWGRVKLVLYGITLMLAAAIFVGANASATEPKAYWDGPGKIIIKHPFFMYNELDGETDYTDIDNATPYKIDPYSRYPFRFVSEDVHVKIADGDSSCTFIKFYFDLEPQNDGTFIAKAPYEYKGGKAPAALTPALGWIGSVMMDMSGESGVGILEASVNTRFPTSIPGVLNKPCERAFHGGPGLAPSGMSHIINREAEGLLSPFTIRGNMGAIADITAFKEQAADSKEGETTRFEHRTCSAFTVRDKKCVDEATDAYDIIWQYCEREAVALYDNYRRIESFKACIQNKSGVDVHATSFDASALNRIDYAGGESCSIRYIGWIICPLSRFMASVTDAAFDGLSEFFIIRPLDRDEDAGRALYRAWSLVNNFANVAFIIGFLLIIFSQLTGRGITNYGIKKLLPKIILTAILVNISYYACIIAVDVSNILGSSLKDVIKSIEPETFTKPSTWSSEVENMLVFGGAAVGAAYIVLTGSIVAMLPLLLGALISLLIAVIMLVARYAIILLLIVLAPIAIACTLLPNTQKWYNQWFKLFTSMLMLFPMIAIVFGASQVAGIVVLNSSLSRSTGDITLQLFGLAIMALPLAITPILVRLSGGVLNRFGGVVSNNGFFNKTRQRTDDFVKRKQNARDVRALQRTGNKRRGGIGGIRDRIRQREYLRKAKQTLNTNQLGKSQSQYANDYAAGQHGGDKTSLLEKGKGILPGYDPKTKGEKFSANMAQGGVSSTAAQAMEISAKAEVTKSLVDAAKAGDTIKKAMSPDADGNLSDLVAIATNSDGNGNDMGIQDMALRQAALEIALANGSDQDAITIAKAASKNNMNKDMRRAVAKGVTSKNVTSKAPYFAQPGVERTIMSGNAAGDGFTQNIVAPYYQSGEYSEMAMGTMGRSALIETENALGSMPQADRQQVIATARSASQNDRVTSKSRGGSQAIDKLREIGSK